MSDVYGKWGTGEPNNAGGQEECVVLRADGTYNDDNCSHVFPYICKEHEPQLDVVNSDISVPASKSKEIFFRNDYKYLRHKDSFYKAHPVPMQWESARRKCIMEGASLFYPEDEDEVHEVTRYLNQTQPWFQYMFVGISTRLASGLYMTVDGETIRNVFNEWYRKVPSGANGRNSCVTLSREGFLNDIKCSEERPFVCKKKAASIEWSKDCDVPYKDYIYNADTGSCYKFHLQRLNWREAVEACDDEQAKLAIINTVEEANYLVNISNNTPKDMVRGWYLCPYVHLGYNYDATENDWRTITGEPIRNVFNKWYRKVPSGANGRNSCVTLSREGFLNDIKCSEERPFVCKKKAASIEWSKDCDVPYKDYIYNADTGSCYKFHLQRLNWREAVEACDDEQAKLAIINNMEEANYLVNISNNTPKDMVRGWYLCPYVHLGYNYDVTENDWRTITGESLQKAGYSVWDDYQVDGEGERCGAMLYNGRLNDVNCENLKCFFACEIEKGRNMTAYIRR
ncbi:Macrophage mannose receptor 1 [Papilio xuthus]|uniref:Macrophage mannose receptor 1 n=1 Tax=Papilio xuthus TaxID=66420 RepID=A0A194QHR4_PAPXU|nr:Macrophage mannose receptor 1 [Papilio xuthus]